MTNQLPTIRGYNAHDWPALEAIYQAGIDSQIATFEKQPKSQLAFEQEAIAGLTFVADTASSDRAHTVIGWAAAWPVSSRSCYRGVAEVSLYIDPAFGRRGIGTLLLSHLIHASEDKGFWTLQAGIFPQNHASIHTHEKCGFKQVGIREKIAQNQGLWQDIALFERRSTRV